MTAPPRNDQMDDLSGPTTPDGSQPSQPSRPVARRTSSALAVLSVGLLVITVATILSRRQEQTGEQLAAANDDGKQSAPTYLGSFAPVERPAGLAVDEDGFVYVVDSAHGRVMVFAPDGSIARTLGHPADATPPEPGEFVNPIGVAVDPGGRVFVSDLAARRITVFEANGGGMTVLAAEALIDSTPGILAFADGALYVADLAHHVVLRIDPDGELLATFAAPADDPMRYPNGIWVFEDGSVLVADANNNRVLRFAVDGSMTGRLEGQFLGPRGLAVDAAGRFYVAEPLVHRVTITDSAGSRVLEQGDGGPALGFPTAIAIDDRLLYVTDRAGRGVQVWQLPE